MPHYTVDKVFDRVLKREMEVLIAERSKSCQSGAVKDLATERLIETYFLKSQYDDMLKSRDYERSLYEMTRSEVERYQEALRKGLGERK